MESITAIVGEKCANWCVCQLDLVYCSPNKRLAPSIKLKHLRNKSRGRGGAGAQKAAREHKHRKAGWRR